MAAIAARADIVREGNGDLVRLPEIAQVAAEDVMDLGLRDARIDERAAPGLDHLSKYSFGLRPVDGREQTERAPHQVEAHRRHQHAERGEHTCLRRHDHGPVSYTHLDVSGRIAGGAGTGLAGAGAHPAGIVEHRRGEGLAIGAPALDLDGPDRA